MRQRRTNFLEQEEREYAREPRPKKRGFLLFIIITILVFFASGCISRTVHKYSAPDMPEAYDPVTLEPKAPEGLIKRLGHFVFSQDVVLDGQRKDRINVLLLGMGGPGHDGPYLTDTIIIASIQPSTNEISMVSIPRDLGVKIPGRGWKKINHANAYGEVKKGDWGAAFASEVIEDTFDTKIHYYVRIDFKAFEHIINDVGGITVNVDRSFEDHMYPAPNNEYQSVTFSKGKTKMEGEKALHYARSRHGNNGEGSDFARAKRQQKMIVALKEKVLSFATLSNPVRIHNIIKTLDEHIVTNMEFSDIIAFIKLAKTLQTNNIKTVVLDSSPKGFLQNGYSPDGAFILEPKSGSFKDINKMIGNIFDSKLVVEYKPEVQDKPKIQEANIEVLNGTWRAGMAARIRKRLTTAGFDVSSIGNTEERPQLTSGIYNIKGRKVKEVVSGLQEELRLPVKKDIPDGVSPTSTTDILVILGEDLEE
jgi:polyisoprenyl-teichoic acid--peptidoglycan teichoic acid transferase